MCQFLDDDDRDDRSDAHDVQYVHGISYASSLGKALLAWETSERRDAVMAGMTYTRFRKSSIAGPEQFLEERERTRQRKYGIGNQEFEEHVICMSAPIFDCWNSVVAGLSGLVPGISLRSEQDGRVCPNDRRRRPRCFAGSGLLDRFARPTIGASPH